MADLLSSSITGSFITKRNPSNSGSNVDLSSTMFTGSTASEFATEMQEPDIEFEIAYDPFVAGRFVAVWADEDNNNYATARIGKVDGRSIIWGPSIVVDPNPQNQANGPSICCTFDPITANRFVVSFNDGKTQFITGTITGLNVITLGPQVTGGGSSQFATGGIASSAIAMDPNVSGNIVLVYRDPSNGYGYAIFANINSAGVLSTYSSSITAFTSFDCDQLDIEFLPLAASANGRFIVSYDYRASPNHGGTRIGTVSGNGFAAFGTEVKFSEDAAVKWSSISYDVLLAAGYFVVTYTKDWQSTKVCCCKVGYINGTVITYGAEAAYRTSGGYGQVAFNPTTPGEFIVAFRKIVGTDYDGFAIKGTVTYSGSAGSTIAYTGTGTEFRDGTNIGLSALSLAFDPNYSKFVIAHGFRDAGSEHSGHVIVGVCSESRITVDLATGNFFEVDLGTNTSTWENITVFTINNTSATHVSSFVLKITQGNDSEGNTRQFDWDKLTHIKWPSDEGATLTETNNAIDILSFTTYDNGTTWHGSVVGQNFI